MTGFYPRGVLWISCEGDDRTILMGGGGDSSNKDCFGRKTNLFCESGDFAGNRETWEVFQEK